MLIKNYECKVFKEKFKVTTLDSVDIESNVAGEICSPFMATPEVNSFLKHKACRLSFYQIHNLDVLVYLVTLAVPRKDRSLEEITVNIFDIKDFSVFMNHFEDTLDRVLAD
jgi:hypothetical protein